MFAYDYWYCIVSITLKHLSEFVEISALLVVIVNILCGFRFG